VASTTGMVRHCLFDDVLRSSAAVTSAIGEMTSAAAAAAVTSSTVVVTSAIGEMTSSTAAAAVTSSTAAVTSAIGEMTSAAAAARTHNGDDDNYFFDEQVERTTVSTHPDLRTNATIPICCAHVRQV